MGYPKRHTHVWRGLALLLVAGCAPGGGDSEVAVLVRSLSAPTSETESGEVMHDLGTVLARGQTLRHVFTLRNPSNEPLRILGAEALTPCCSRVGDTPRTIAPHSYAQVPVFLRADYQSGRRLARFIVRTDSPEIPNFSLALTGAFLAEVEIETQRDSATSLPLGQGGKQVLLVTSRRSRGAGRWLLESVKASSGVTARISGTSVVRSNANGIEEAVSVVEVELPASLTAGPKCAPIILGWPDGKTHEHRVDWHARACVEAVPPGLMIDPTRDRPEHVVLIRSVDRPIRIVSVQGATVRGDVEACQTARHMHALRLSPHALSDSEPAADIEITTDHPAQPNVVVTVMIARGYQRRR